MKIWSEKDSLDEEKSVVWYQLEPEQEQKEFLKEHYEFFKSCSSRWSFSSEEKDSWLTFRLPEDFLSYQEAFDFIVSFLEDPEFRPSDQLWTKEFFLEQKPFLLKITNYFLPLTPQGGRTHLPFEVTHWLRRKNLLVYLPSDFYLDEYLQTLPLYREIYRGLQTYRLSRERKMNKITFPRRRELTDIFSPWACHDDSGEQFILRLLPFLPTEIVLLSNKFEGFNKINLCLIQNPFLDLDPDEEKVNPKKVWEKVLETLSSEENGLGLSGVLVSDENVSLELEDGPNNYFFQLERRIYTNLEEVLACVPFDYQACCFVHDPLSNKPICYTNQRYDYYEGTMKIVPIPQHIYQGYHTDMSLSPQKILIPGHLDHFNCYNDPYSNKFKFSFLYRQMKSTTYEGNPFSASLLIPEQEVKCGSVCSKRDDEINSSEEEDQCPAPCGHDSRTKFCLSDLNDPDVLFSTEVECLDEEGLEDFEKEFIQFLTKSSFREPSSKSEERVGYFCLVEPGDILPEGTVLPEGTILPKGFQIPSGSLWDGHRLSQSLILKEEQDVPPKGLTLKGETIIPKPGISYHHPSPSVSPKAKKGSRIISLSEINERSLQGDLCNVIQSLTRGKYKGKFFDFLEKLDYFRLDEWKNFDRRKDLTGIPSFLQPPPENDYFSTLS